MKNASNLIIRLKSVITLVPLILLLPVCTVLAETNIGQVRPLQLMDVFDLEYAANPGFSPDGRHIIYERRFMDVMNDRARSNLWQIDVRNGNQKPLVTGLVNASQPAFSPDGKFLAYVSNESGQSRLYLRWRDTSDSIIVTQRVNPVSNPVFSPDSRWIAFTSRVDEAASSYAKMPDKPRGAKWAEPARIIDRPVYRFDGAGFLPRGYQQVFVVPATGGTARQLTFAQRNHNSALAFSDDGKSLLLSANMTADPYFNPANSDIIRLDIASGEITQLTDRDGPDNSPAISPDGRWIAYSGYDDRKLGYHNSQIYIMRADGTESRSLTAGLDRSANSPQWSDDGRHVYFQFDDEGNTRIARVDLNGKISNLASDLGGTAFGRPYAGGSFDVSPSGDLAYTWTSTQDLSNIALLKRGRDSITRMTDLNADLLEYRDLAPVEEIWYESSFDGQRIQGWLARPPGFEEGKQYPLILEIHGGPFTNYGTRFSPEVQLYAAAGYLVLYTNPRGSTSYGHDFANLIHHNYPGQDYDDLISGVELLVEQGLVDPERLYVTGGSGGGVLTSWIIGKTDRFRAAVVAKPVINWISFTLYADISWFVASYWFAQMPWEDPMAYWKRSPISLVGNVTTPTMLLTGEADFRTPIVETEQYYQALKMRGIDTVMVRIPGASHGITRRPSNLIAKVSHIIKWFDNHGGRVSSDAEDNGE